MAINSNKVFHIKECGYFNNVKNSIKKNIRILPGIT